MRSVLKLLLLLFAELKTKFVKTNATCASFDKGRPVERTTAPSPHSESYLTNYVMSFVFVLYLQFKSKSEFLFCCYSFNTAATFKITGSAGARPLCN